MRMRVLLATGALAIVPALAGAQRPPATAAAHRGGGIELSAGGSLFTVDRALNAYLSQPTVRIVNRNPSRFMFGGEVRATYNFSRHLGLSLGSASGNGNGSYVFTPFGALAYTLDLNRRFSPFIEAGGGLTRFSPYSGVPFLRAGDSTRSAYGAFGGLGVRSMLGRHFALRMAGRMTYAKYSALPSAAYNGTVTLGLSYFLGGRSPRDTDGDGVPDRRDACADTPVGATVDAQGCALDSDTDAVYDGLDQCPGTPAGATVDAQGCALDSDTDGVFDGLDRCPDTPAGVTVDANGCPIDSDGDGVPDHRDRCANTPAGTPVDANGCPRDTDNDGVTDNLDRCADTPANARPVDAGGCPLDSDRDGVADYLDRCANTAAGTQVGANGCPVRRDADGDGVLDSSDRCPNTPAGSRVDANGCPPAEPTGLPALPDVGQSLVLSAVQFSAAGSRLTGASQTVLDGIAAAIIATPNSRWEVAGHTSSTGTRAGNLQLSQARARAVARYLISRGVGTGVLTAVGYGSANPVAPNTTAVGRAQNRRVEIKRLQ